MASGNQSLDRALTLLEAIIRNDGLTAASTIAARLDMRASSARRLLAAFRDRGLIRAVAHGRYAGGPLLSDLAAALNPHRTLIESARPLLKGIAKKTGWASHLGVLDNDMVTYLVKEGGHELFTREGAQLEAYCTGIGKVLLAHLPECGLQKYLTGTFVPMTTATIIDPQRLKEEILLTRERGYAIDDCEMSDGLVCVAVPVLIEHLCLGALSISGDVRSFPASQASQIAVQLQKLAVLMTKHVVAYGGIKPPADVVS